MAEALTFVGLKNLAEHESSMIKKVAEQQYGKVSRHLKDAKLKIAVRTINSEGNAKEYDLTAYLEASKMRFEASNSGWDLSVVLHELLDSLHNQAKKKLKLTE